MNESSPDFFEDLLKVAVKIMKTVPHFRTIFEKTREYFKIRTIYGHDFLQHRVHAWSMPTYYHVKQVANGYGSGGRVSGFRA